MSKESKKAKFTLTEDILIVEELGKAIKEVSDAFKKMNEGPLTRRALVVLIHDQMGAGGPNKTQISQVLTAAADLNIYLTKKE